MNITVYGAGPIGLTTALGLCHLGHQVQCIDIDHFRISKLQDGILPFFEPGLRELLKTSLMNQTIFFQTKPNDNFQSLISFIAIGAPNIDKIPNTTEIEKLIYFLSEKPKKQTIFIKSTVPPGTAKKIKNQISLEVNLVSHPEFLREGLALSDFLNPDRLVFGGEHLDLNLLHLIYPNVAQEKFLLMSHEEAELSKYIANSYLAQRVSFINQISKLCDHYQVDIGQIKKSISSDHRIGAHFFNSGLGFGGSCFPKDLVALNSIAQQIGVRLSLIESTLEINANQIHYFSQKITSYFNLHLTLEKKITLWGASFKPNTSDLRESQSLKLLQKLIELNYSVNIYDPACFQELNQLFADTKNITVCESLDNSLNNSNAVIIATEWAEFKNYGLEKIKASLKHPALFDGRNLFNRSEAERIGLNYFGVGQ